MGTKEKILLWRGKKRGRNPVENTSRKRNFLGFNCAASLFVFLALLPGAFAKSSFYNTCFEHLRKADDNGDLLLSREEYSKLLITISGGAVLLQNETPPVLTDLYTNRLQEGAQAVGIKGVQVTSVFTTVSEIGFVESLCRDIYAGLLSIFDIEISAEQCSTAFQSADLSSTKGNLSSDEYSFFVVSLTKDVSFLNLNFTDLANTIQDVFNDMSVESEIQREQGAAYILEFCQRVAIAVEIVEVVNASMPTISPTTKAPASKPVSIQTEAPTFNPAEVRPTANLPPEYAPCKNALIASDINSNLWLDFSEYGPLIELLSSKRVSSASFDSLDSIFQDTYSEFLSSGDSLSLGALKSGSHPNSIEIQTLVRICNATSEAIAFYETENDALYAPSLSPIINSDGSSSDSFYQNCKSSMILSDLNRNKLLDETEFVHFVSKMTTNADFSMFSFDDLSVALQDVFVTASSSTASGISISSISPGQEPSGEVEIHFRNICIEVHDALLFYDTNSQKSISPSEQFSPSESPSSHSGRMSAELFRVCIFAIDIADTDRDDALDKVEYMRFLNRLTISEFSGLEFSDIVPILQNGFNEVAVDGKIDVYGTKPGLSRTETEENHLQDVCEAVYSAIEDYHSGKSFESPDDTASNKCITTLSDADVDRSGHLNESEYMLFFKLFIGMNATKSFDTLPYLLKESFNLLSLGNDSINISRAAHVSSSSDWDAVRLKWICNRIEETLHITSKMPHNSTFEDFCDVSTLVSDQDNDGFLSEDEYAHLVSLFSAGSMTDSDFETLDEVFRRSYQKGRNITNGLIEIEEAKSGGLCENVQDGINSSQPSVIFLELCFMAANNSDLDSNGNLNETEYSPFIMCLLNIYGLTNSSSHMFESIYATLNGNCCSHPGTRNPIDNAVSYGKICKSVEHSFGITNSNLTSVSIKNSFFISNEVGISASDLTSESAERRALDKSYVLFVESQVLQISKRRARNLALESNALSSPEINQIVDIPCPTESQRGRHCQKLAASFDILLSRDDEASTVTDFFGNKTKKAIEEGELQRILTTVDPQSSLVVMNYTELLQPALNTTENSDDESSSDGPAKFGLFVVLGVALGASFFGAGLFYFLTNSRIRVKRDTGFNTKHDTLAVDELNEDEKHYGVFHVASDRKTEDVELGKASIATDFLISSYLDDDCRTGISETTRSPETNNDFKSAFVVNDDSESESDYISSANFVDSSDHLVDIEQSHSDDEIETMSSIGFSTIVFDDAVDEASVPSHVDEAEDISSGEDRTWQNDIGSKSKEKEIKGIVSECIRASCLSVDTKESIMKERLYAKEGEMIRMDCDEETLDVKAVPEYSQESTTGNFDALDTERTEVDALRNVCPDDCLGAQASVLADDKAVSVISDETFSDESESVRSDSEEEEEKEKVEAEREMKVDVESIRVTSGHDEDCEKGNASSIDFSDESASATGSDDDDSESVSQSATSEPEEHEASLADESVDSEDCEQSLSSLGEDNTSMHSVNSLDSACIRESYEKYRPIIEDLIRHVMPDEINNVDAMMEQFIGKEHELVETLRNMAVSEKIDTSGDDDSSEECESSEEEEGAESDVEESESDGTDNGDESDDEEFSSVNESDDDRNSEGDNDSEDSEISEGEESNGIASSVEESEYSEETVEEDEVEESCIENEDTSEEVESSEYESD